MNAEQELKIVHETLNNIFLKIEEFYDDRSKLDSLSLIQNISQQIIDSLHFIKTTRNTNIKLGTDRNSRELAFQFIQQAPLELAIFDRMGHYLVATDQWLSRMKVSRPDVIGKSIYDLYPPSKSRRHFHQKALNGAFLSGFDEAFIIENSEKYYFNWSIGPLINSNEKIIGFFIVRFDVTHQMNEHDTILQKLSETNKMEALGLLASGLSHDFNNFLTIILGNLELSQKYIENLKALEYIDRSIHAALTAGDLNHRLLKFAKTNNLLEEVFELDLAIKDISSLLKRTLGENIDFFEKLTAHDALVRVDRAELESSIINLLINSRNAMPKGGACNILTEVIFVDAARAKAQDVDSGFYCKISITDTGVGMSQETLKRAIEPFFSTHKDHGGTGLGLSTVHSFVRRSGGFMEMFSERDVGTTVSIYIPNEKNLLNPTNTYEEDLPAGKGETILVIEDNIALRSIVMNYLTSLGYYGLEASSGAEAIEIIKSRSDINLILTDLMMPGNFSGIDIANFVMKSSLKVPLIFMTGNQGYLSENKGKIKNTHLLLKPFTRRDLAKIIKIGLTQKSIS